MIWIPGIKTVAAFVGVTLLLLAGCGAEKKKPVLLNNWSELCATEDCSQYPVG